MDSVKLISTLANSFGAPGFEDDVIAAVSKFVPDSHKMVRDKMLNLFLVSEPKENKPVVVLDAHMDEVGAMVKAVKDNGTIVFAPLGDWVPSTLYAQRMQILNRDNELVTAVIASKMTHFGAGQNYCPSIDQMLLDVGAICKEEVMEEFRIYPGCPITPSPNFEKAGDIIISKALDNRLGCAAVLEILNKVSEMDLDINVDGILTAQEEVGHRGATVASQSLKPDLVICFEGSPCDDTLAEVGESHLIQTRMGDGPMIRYMDAGMITNPRLMRFVLNVAKKHGIEVQEAVRTRSFTNGAAYNLTHAGTPTIVISCPVRYAHSHNGMAYMYDYHSMVELTIEVLKEITEEVIREF